MDRKARRICHHLDLPTSSHTIRTPTRKARESRRTPSPFKYFCCLDLPQSGRRDLTGPDCAGSRSPAESPSGLGKEPCPLPPPRGMPGVAQCTDETGQMEKRNNRGGAAVGSVCSVAIHSGHGVCRDGLRLSRWRGLLPDGNVLPRKCRMNLKKTPPPTDTPMSAARHTRSRYPASSVPPQTQGRHRLGR